MKSVSFRVYCVHRSGRGGGRLSEKDCGLLPLGASRGAPLHAGGWPAEETLPKLCLCTLSAFKVSRARVSASHNSIAHGNANVGKEKMRDVDTPAHERLSTQVKWRRMEYRQLWFLSLKILLWCNSVTVRNRISFLLMMNELLRHTKSRQRPGEVTIGSRWCHHDVFVTKFNITSTSPWRFRDSVCYLRSGNLTPRSDNCTVHFLFDLFRQCAL